jgi:hypothetical protein
MEGIRSVNRSSVLSGIVQLFPTGNQKYKHSISPGMGYVRVGHTGCKALENRKQTMAELVLFNRAYE